jgi:parallel beta-helix repeat protein
MPIIERYRQYEIVKRPDGSLWELGAGAMGITYKAFDTNLQRFVALKVINDTYLANATAKEQFLREARSAAALRHPNVASIHDLGTDHDCHFYVMELIDGITVRAKIEQNGPMPPKQALDIVLQVAQALMAAEKQKLIHRDIKPANLMLVDENGELAVKIIDFGLAKMANSLGESTASFTIAGGFVGTAEYASPEQIRENELDIRSDIYSVGATFFYMLAGRPPFTGSPGEVMSKHLYKPVPLDRLAGMAPPVVALVEKLMEKEPENRPRNAAEFRLAVEQSLEELSPSTVARYRTNSPSEPIPQTDTQQRYNLLKRLDQTPQGDRFLALDKQTGKGVDVFAFNHKFLNNAYLLVALRNEVEALKQARHPLLRIIFAFEQFADAARLILESFTGLPLLAILRVRKALSPVETNMLLDRLAPLADFAQKSGLKQVDLNLSGIWLAASPGVAPRPESSLQSWPALELKVDPIDLSSSPSLSRNSQSEVTAISPIVAGGTRGSYLRQLGLLAYELLGGHRQQVETSGRCPPLTLLKEEANVVLRNGIIDNFPSAAAFADAFRRALTGQASKEPQRKEVAAERPYPVVRTELIRANPPEPIRVTPPPVPPPISEPAQSSSAVANFVVPDQYPTIQKAIDAAEPGATVLVKPGIYREILRFKNGIELSGENPDTTIVRWTNSTAGDQTESLAALTILDCATGVVRDLTFDYECPEPAEDPAEQHRPDGIRVVNSSVTIRNCRLNQFPACGIAVSGSRSSPSLIENQCRHSGDAGIVFRDGAQGSVSANVCEQNGGHGILVIGPETDPILLNNQCRKNQMAGIYLIRGAKGKIENNICDGNVLCGIMLFGSAPYLSANQLVRNLQCGLAYDAKSKLSLGKRNTFAENKQGDLLTKPVVLDRS